MLKILLKYWHFALLAILFMVCEVAVDMIQPRLMATIVDDGILGLSGDGTPDLSLITSTGILMILVVVAGGLTGMLSGTMANLCSQRFGNDVRKRIFERIMHLSFQQTDTFTTGSLITRVTNDVTQLERLVQQSVRGFVRCIMFMVVGTITLLSLNQHFLVIIACAFPLVLLDIIFILWRTNPLFLRLQNRIDNMNTVIRENINGARLVKAFIQEDREEERFRRANQLLVKTQLRILILMSYLRPVMNIILNLATVALIWIGAIQVQQGGMQPGEVMAAVTYISQILNGMMMLAMIFQTLSRGMASYKRIRAVLDTEPVIRDPEDLPDEGTEQAAHVTGSPAPCADISFEHIFFAYPVRSQEEGQPSENTDHVDRVDTISRPSIPLEQSIREMPGSDLTTAMDRDGYVLRDINLHIQAGETLAIVGATGCGKTTLVNLIPRFYEPAMGTVRIGGRDVRSLPLQQLREQVAFVTQKNELFSTTIEENIRIGRPGASREEIAFAARCAQAEEFILQQPEGYATPVAEGGMSLSGGQRQRIAIARALLKRSEILIFDDSTSALDLRTEAALYDALQTHFADRTRIVIAQRITTARRADRIAVMDKGRLVGIGTHEALLTSCPVYADICASQMRAEEGLGKDDMGEEGMRKGEKKPDKGGER